MWGAIGAAVALVALEGATRRSPSRSIRDAMAELGRTQNKSIVGAVSAPRVDTGGGSGDEVNDLVEKGLDYLGNYIPGAEDVSAEDFYKGANTAGHYLHYLNPLSWF